MKAVLQDVAWASREPRLVVDEALRLMKEAGEVRWGVNLEAYTRRRTLLDSFLRYDYEGVVQSMGASASTGDGNATDVQGTEGPTAATVPLYRVS